MKRVKVKYEDGITDEASRAMNKANRFASDVDYCIKHNGNRSELLKQGEKLLADYDFQAFDAKQFKALVKRKLELLRN